MAEYEEKVMVDSGNCAMRHVGESRRDVTFVKIIARRRAGL